MHTIGQKQKQKGQKQKRLLLVREEGDRPKWGAGLDFGGAGSG